MPLGLQLLVCQQSEPGSPIWLIEYDEDSDEIHSLGDGIENINIEQFASPGLSSTRLGDPVLEICSKLAPNFEFNR